MNVQEAVDRLGGLPLKRYCQLTGESSNTVYQRIHKGIWQAGQQFVKIEGAGVWVLLDGVGKWLKGASIAALLTKDLQA